MKSKVMTMKGIMRRAALPVLAAGMLLAVGCTKPVSYSSFVLTPSIRDASGAKTTWSANGLFWSAGGDVVSINGNMHRVVHGGGTEWHTEGVQTGALADGNFYIASPATSGAWSEGSRTFGPVSFDGDNVPLACVGKTNKLTLYPCCAVLKVQGLTNNVVVELYTDENLVDTVEVPMRGTIDIVGRRITGGSGYTNMLEGTVSGGDTYFVIPMTGNSVSAALLIYDDDGNEGNTNAAYTLNKGTLYTIDPADF